MTDSVREAFEAWIEAPDEGYKDQASIYWSAFASGAKHARATSAAEAEIRRWKARCIAAENGHPQVKEATSTAEAKYLPLAEAWLRYKQDMRPETRNDYLRASSRVFDCAIPGLLLGKREGV